MRHLFQDDSGNLIHLFEEGWGCLQLVITYKPDVFTVGRCLVAPPTRPVSYIYIDEPFNSQLETIALSGKIIVERLPNKEPDIFLQDEGLYILKDGVNSLVWVRYVHNGVWGIFKPGVFGVKFDGWYCQNEPKDCRHGKFYFTGIAFRHENNVSTINQLCEIAAHDKV